MKTATITYTDLIKDAVEYDAMEWEKSSIIRFYKIDDTNGSLHLVKLVSAHNIYSIDIEEESK
jgi:hypothetical protein